MSVQANNFTTKYISYQLSTQNIAFATPPPPQIMRIEGVEEIPAAQG